jgi:pimeloyl-ACP methyl ester carboxylesterase/Ca2+-binding EF-hand superfamily protein
MISRLSILSFVLTTFASQVLAQPPGKAKSTLPKALKPETVLKLLGAKQEQGATKKQREDYARHFDRFDLDKDGRHSKEEYIEKGGYLNPQARRGIFGAADANKDGFVSRDEYVLNRIITDESKALIQAMDLDQDGRVQRSEFLDQAAARFPDPKHAGQVFAALDTNGDGHLIVPEYLRVWGQWARADKRSATERLSMDTGQVLNLVTHHFAENDGVKIHYASLGKGPLIIMIHGFPDFWYTWREQMIPLSKAGFQVVAIDQRGYNESDKPKGVDQYGMDLLVNDVAAVIRDTGHAKAILCGHDWGGAVAWTIAMTRPQLVDRLMILNLPHPRGLARELANNPGQQKNSAYARRFQEPDAHLALNAETLSAWVKDPAARKHYLEAFKRSDFEAMLNYYKKNYPREPYNEPETPVVKVDCPVLMIHGLDDKALLPGALNNTWNWLKKDLTLVTVPGAGHFVQQDASDLVTRSMLMWLGR